MNSIQAKRVMWLTARVGIGVVLLFVTATLAIAVIFTLLHSRDLTADNFLIPLALIFCLCTYSIFRIFIYRGNSVGPSPMLPTLTGLLTWMFGAAALTVHGASHAGLFGGVALIQGAATWALLRQRSFFRSQGRGGMPPGGDTGQIPAPLIPRDSPPHLSAEAELPKE